MRLALSILFALSACGADRDVRPDAAQPAADAAIDSPADAPPRQQGECNMGNLPTSRTITINTGDPIPAAVVNELQDMIVGASRKQWTRPEWPPIIFGAANVIEAANPAGSVPVRKITAACTLYLDIQYDQDDVIQGLSFEAYGDGAVDMTQAQLAYGPDMHSAQPVISTNLTQTNVPAAWNPYTLAVTPTTLGTGPLSLILTVNAGNFYFGKILVAFSRP